jgi:hypothetical protein
MLGEGFKEFLRVLGGLVREPSLTHAFGNLAGDRAANLVGEVVAAFEERFDKLELRGGERPGLGGR